MRLPSCAVVPMVAPGAPARALQHHGGCCTPRPRRTSPAGFVLLSVQLAMVTSALSASWTPEQRRSTTARGRRARARWRRSSTTTTDDRRAPGSADQQPARERRAALCAAASPRAARASAPRSGGGGRAVQVRGLWLAKNVVHKESSGTASSVSKPTPMRLTTPRRRDGRALTAPTPPRSAAAAAVAVDAGAAAAGGAARQRISGQRQR